MLSNYDEARHRIETHSYETPGDHQAELITLGLLAAVDEIRDLRLALSSVNPRQVTPDFPADAGVLTEINNTLESYVRSLP